MQRRSLSTRRKTESWEKKRRKTVAKAGREEKWKQPTMPGKSLRKSAGASQRAAPFYSETDRGEIHSRKRSPIFLPRAACPTNRRPFIAPTKLAPAAPFSDAPQNTP